ncbi:Stk1 family PASTA domain-containing Ser/Thr kinase [Caldalkalibacillus salinus]|uniref:Stk1 family PASTA domain-containing Ser/Thr kinase n=1 Tax=Caldalkalibacillus salinus TaxID=2803787 RepID=UPI0019240896|nr:Stk1 family PASTA domain-containing Ser/Thr kinase [Caldalkalibacillus salinus]
MIGKKIVGRYEVLDRVGGGGMAIVYKAKDELLNRIVALKILRPQYAIDDDFVNRFRREAQAAASLSHPNIVSIYDVGVEEDVHYIVMELVEGWTLKEYIKEHGPLPSEDAVSITKQIAEALEHAHHNQIIHRDIKPHNILINRDKKIKVTDFGIARAVSSSTITHTGSVVGSVHYFSPEQAKGGITGEKSDIYSLGVVLYEMVTGELPFSGDSPITVALKHLQDKFQDPRHLNPSIPQSVENIILRALARDPLKRYASARELIETLETALSPERLNEQKIDLTDDADDEEATKVMPVIHEDMLEGQQGHDDASSVQQEDGWKSSNDSENQDVLQSNDDHESLHEDDEEDESDTKRPLWVKLLISFVVVSLLGFGVVKGTGYVLELLYVKEIEVEDVTHLSEEEAREILEKQGFQIDKRTVFHDEVEEGHVITQSPVGGGTAKENSHIRLTISLGQQKERMGSFQYMHEQTVRGLLRDFKAIEVEYEKHPELSEGMVISQQPEANEWVVPEETTVRLVVSSGKSVVNMPNLVGLSEQAAEATLLRYNLELDAIERDYSDYNKGVVYRQHPIDPQQEVEPGTPITIWVSKGKKDAQRNVTEDIEITLEENEVANIEIYVSDANREEEKVIDEQIEESQRYSLNLKVSPMQDGTITVYKNGQIHEGPKTVTYEQEE